MPATTIEAVMQMRRGLENDLDISQLRIGEWALSTDKKWVRICYAENKVIKIASQEAMDETLAEIQEIEDAILVMKNAAAASATSASGSATSAEGSAEDAEAWAVGTRDGVTVPSTDPAYNNNSKYWAQHAVQSLDNLTDTDISNPSNNDVLKYNSTSGKWENGVGGGSGSGGHTIKDGAGNSMTQRAALQFSGGFEVSDDSTNDLTKVQKDIPITWEQWNQLTSEQAAGNDYYITDEPYVNGQASADVFTKLWENPNPATAFAAQNITLASDDYDFLLIVYRHSTGFNGYKSVIEPKNVSTMWLDVSDNSGNGSISIVRTATKNSDTSYAFASAYYSIGTSASTEDNTFIIPQVIYGIKKSISFDFTAVIANVSTDAAKCMLPDNSSVEDHIAASYEITVPTTGYTQQTVTIGGVSKTLQVLEISTDKDGNSMSQFTSGMKEDYALNISGSASDFSKLYAHEIGEGEVTFYFTSAPSSAFNVLIREAV